MNRLDEIKAQVADAQESGADAVSANILNEVSDLVAAIEAVLDLHAEVQWPEPWLTCGHCSKGQDLPVHYPCETVAAIRGALGETE